MKRERNSHHRLLTAGGEAGTVTEMSKVNGLRRAWLSILTGETPRWSPLLLGVLAGLLFLTSLGARDFWAPVESRYAEIARIMFARGEWVVPTVNGEIYTDKPILFFWLVLVGSNLAGSVNEWVVRLPSALSAVGLVLTVYFLGRQLFTPRIGFMAAVIIATSVRVLLEGRWAHTDMLLTLLLTLTLYFFARALLRGDKGRAVLVAYALMGARHVDQRTHRFCASRAGGFSLYRRAGKVGRLV